MERHVDGVVEGCPPQLHVHVDGLHHQSRCAGAGRLLLRRGSGQPKACPEIATKYQDTTHCDVFKATDEAFAKSISFWATPRKKCLDGSGNDCVPFVDWIKAWTEIKG